MERNTDRKWIYLSFENEEVIECDNTILPCSNIVYLGSFEDICIMIDRTYPDIIEN